MSHAAKHSRDQYHVGDLALQLVAAAGLVLEEVGSAKLSLRAISESLGVSPAAAYHHFHSRTELLACLAAQGYELLARQLVSATLGKTGKQRLHAVVSGHLEFACNSPVRYQLMFSSELSGEPLPRLRRSREDAFREFGRVFEPVGETTTPSFNRKSVVSACAAYIHGLASLAILGECALEEGNGSRADSAVNVIEGICESLLDLKAPLSHNEFCKAPQNGTRLAG